jgi:hypothetical protein
MYIIQCNVCSVFQIEINHCFLRIPLSTRIWIAGTKLIPAAFAIAAVLALTVLLVSRSVVSAGNVNNTVEGQYYLVTHERSDPCPTTCHIPTQLI